MESSTGACDGSKACKVLGTRRETLTSGATDSPPSPILEKKRPSPDSLGGKEAPWVGVAACCEGCLSRPPAAAASPPLLSGEAAAAALAAVFVGVGCGVPSVMTNGSRSCAAPLARLWHDELTTTGHDCLFTSGYKNIALVLLCAQTSTMIAPLETLIMNTLSTKLPGRRGTS